MNFKAIIFDRDGVIIDTEPVNLSSALFAFQRQGIEISDEEKKIIVGTHPVDYQAYFLEKYPQFDFSRFREDKLSVFLPGQKKAPLFTPVIDLIKNLQQQNMLLGLVTSSTRPGTLAVLQRAGLDNSFQIIITFEDCDKRKPSPDCYLLAADKLGVKPADCLVIEDTAVGLQAAKNAGMICYVMPGPITANQDFSSADKILKLEDDLKSEIGD